jgi:hypothetical protein
MGSIPEPAAETRWNFAPHATVYCMMTLPPTPPPRPTGDTAADLTLMPNMPRPPHPTKREPAANRPSSLPRGAAAGWLYGAIRVHAGEGTQLVAEGPMT